MTPIVESAKRLTPRTVRSHVKPWLRSFGVLTSALRPLPDFAIIGTHRGGTTSLYNYLLGHPGVAPMFPSGQNLKGTRFFDERFVRGVAWYRSHFPTSAYRSSVQRIHGTRVVAGEASPYYLFHPHAAGRAARTIPNAKLVVLLRDPVDRAYSHWRHQRRHGTEQLGFAEAIEAEPERLAGEVDRMAEDETYYSRVHEYFSYLTQGLYLEPLRRWLEHYARENVVIETSERFADDPSGVYDRVVAFLGLPPHALRSAKRWASHPADDLDPGTRRTLDARVLPHNRRLEEFLGVKLGWGG